MVRAGKTANALERILPNMRGARQDKRKIIASTIQNQLLYGAPLWAGVLKFQNNINSLLEPQRKIALCIAMAYRMVSTPAILVVAGTIPAHFMAKERQEEYRRIQSGIEVNKDVLREGSRGNGKKNGTSQRREDGREDSLRM
ncbi:uncharacterized protein LOC112684921 [Sipha flava]|jgi:hypothetical protein|uniref:Uncharacterized protein LOC112684921 n=1 Tax=Sipha flava TaxID=143950 RepID=A0A2S2R8M1_9HEMI|nr:uncharacterized protein LOC112684921 [Sipha flava]